MKKTVIVVTILLLLAAVLLSCTGAIAATDGVYTLMEVPVHWDGTDGSRLKATSADYDYTYGDEGGLAYVLPWQFTFYGQPYNQINVDTNGNIWLTSTGSAHSFNLINTARGPVIAAWNNDLSSYFNNGVFIQHKTSPERVVIEWQTETYTEEGFYRVNIFETVLYGSGMIRTDYKSFDTANERDIGSGISKSDGTHYLNLSTLYGNAYTLAGRSFIFEPSQFSPTLAVAPPSDSFGTVYVNTTSAAHPFTVSNTGSGALLINSISLDSAEFAIDTNTCQLGSDYVTLLPTENCTVGIKLAPASAGTKTANLTIDSNDPNFPAPGYNVGLNGIARLPILTVLKAGNGTGTLTSSPPAISCGAGCTASFMTGTVVDLAPSPYAGSSFTGWSGGGCSGSGNCTVTLNADTTVTATFTCLNQPVRRMPANIQYTSLAAAYAAAVDGDTIQMRNITFQEGATITKSITLDGGYDCGFANKIGITTLKGSQVRLSDGVTKLKDIFVDD
jgi:hypothetical protein